MDFWKHDSCACGHEARHGHLKLVVPVSALVSHCNAKWMKMLLDNETAYDVMSSNYPHNSLSCAGRLYAQPMTRILHNEQIGVILIGSLKISSSGRLQLVDATGSIDVVVSDLPATWNFGRLYEIKDFSVTMEGVAGKGVQLCRLAYEFFTCRSIFSSTPPVRDVPKSLYLSFNVKDDQFLSCPSPFCMNWKGCSMVLESGKYHMMWLMHKFPVLQKFHGDHVISKKSAVFAEVIMLSWDLVLHEKDGDVDPNLRSSPERDSVRHFPRNEDGECVFKRCKVGKSSAQGSVYDSSNAKYELFSQTPSFLHTHRCSYVERNCCDSNCPSEIPCKISGRSVSDQSVGVLSYTDVDTKIGYQRRQCVRKVLLEFSSESFHLYRALRIGGYYIVKHGKEDISCTIKDCNDPTGLKVHVTSKMHFWGVSFSCNDSIVDSNVSINSDYSFADNNDVSNNRVLSRAETCSDINLCMPASLINFVKFNSEIEDGLLRPPFSVKKETEMHNWQENRISSSLKSFQISYPGNLLPTGNLITLHGLVTLVHDCKQNPFAAHAIQGSSGAIFQPVLLAEGSSSTCVHIMMDNCNVKIVGPLSEGAYPTGFGKGVHASFHRILELDGQNEYRMIPASFIVIDSVNPFNERSRLWNDNAPVTLGSESVTLPVDIPAVFVSELLQSMELKPVRLRCRVLAVYFLILEKNRGAPTCQSELPVLDIALAGFILDDGTSSCCCWANHEIAASLLRLHTEDVPHKFCRTLRSSKQRRVKQVSGLTAGHINEIIQKHGRVIVKNHGSAFDYSCSDLTFSASSGKTFRSSDEDVLRCLILNACFSTLLTVIGSFMDSNAMEQLEKQLIEHQVSILPLQNIWATGIYRVDPLHEARNIFQELVHC